MKMFNCGIYVSLTQFSWKPLVGHDHSYDYNNRKLKQYWYYFIWLWFLIEVYKDVEDN